MVEHRSRGDKGRLCVTEVVKVNLLPVSVH